MRIIQVLAVLANAAAFVWAVYMCVRYVPLPRELPVASMIMAFPLLNIVALVGALRGRKP